MKLWLPNALCFLLALAAATPPVAASDDSRPPFALPATFVGRSPCGDCGGYISITLRLEPDHTYSERDAYRRYPSGRFLGQWRYEYSTNAIVLRTFGHGGIFYRVLNAWTLEPLNDKGDPFPGSEDYRLTSARHDAA
jgi:hypothetical protein